MSVIYRTVLFTICIMFLMVNASSAYGKEKKRKRFDYSTALVDVSSSEARLRLKFVYDQLKGLDDKAEPIFLIPLAREVDFFCRHPFIESETGYKRKWFLRLKKSMDRALAIKLEYKPAALRKDSETMEKLDVLYSKVLKRFKTVLKKPLKIRPDKLKDMRDRNKDKKKILKERLEKAEERRSSKK